MGTEENKKDGASEEEIKELETKLRETTLLDDVCERYPDEEFMSADGFENAILGVEEHSMVLIYSVNKCIEILMEQGMTYEEALEYFSFNVSGAYMGEKTPIWCEDDFKDE